MTPAHCLIHGCQDTAFPSTGANHIALRDNFGPCGPAEQQKPVGRQIYLKAIKAA